jgi:hypothetical protein
LAFRALHQLCAPMLDGLQRLLAPQRDAVRTAFGMSSEPVPDRFLIGLGGVEAAVRGRRAAARCVFGR